MRKLLLTLFILIPCVASAYQFVYNAATGKPDNIGPAAPMSSVSGNVGIGSVHPGSSLDVAGTIRTTNFTLSGNNAQLNYVLTATDSAGDSTWQVASGGGSGNVGIGTTGWPAYYASNGSTVTAYSGMTFVGSNVGIGSVNPGTALDVNGTIRGVGGFFSSNVGIGTIASTPLSVYSPNNTVMSLQSPNVYTFPSNGVLDSFTRANSTTSLGSNWTISTNAGWGNDALGINNNAAYDATGSDGGNGFWNVNSFSGTIEVYDTLQIGPAVGGAGVVCVTTLSSYLGYVLIARAGNDIRLYRVNSSGTFTQIKDIVQAYSNGDSIGFTDTAAGNFTIYYKPGAGSWVSIGTVTDNTYTCAYIGIEINDTTERHINFGGGTTTADGLDLLQFYNGGSINGYMGYTALYNGLGAFNSSSTPLLLVNTLSGNTGIGITAPGQLLDVAGNIRATGTNQVILGSDNSVSLNSSSSSSGDLIAKTNTTDRLHITNLGNVGIGSIVPGQSLDVNGTARMTGFTLTGQGASAGYVIQSNGSLGIGTWVPGTAVNIGIGTYGICTTQGNCPTGSGSPPGGGISAVQYNNPVGTFAGTENIFSFNGKNVGIGTTNGTQPLDVRGTISITGVSGTTNSLTVSTGLVGIGNSSPGQVLDVTGTVKSTGFTQTGSLFNSFSGNTGIGSLAPGSALDVNGTGRMTGFTLSGQGAAASAVLVASSSVGIGTWMAPSTLLPADAADFWTLSGADVYRLSNVGIGTTFTTGGGALSVMNGNVGIGTWGPSALLDVKGTVNMTSFSLNKSPFAGGNVLVSNGIGIGTWMPVSTLGAGGTAAGGISAVQYNNPVGTFAGKENVFSFNGTNVGIGTTNGSNFLDVRGTLTIQALQVTTYGNVGIGSLNPGSYLDVAGTTRITGNGNLGIGSANPGYSIDTNGGIRALGNGTSSFGSNVGIGTTLSANGLDVATTVSIGTSYAGNTTAPSNGLIIQGNVGIASSSPGQNLDVNGTVRILNSPNLSIGTTFPTGAFEVEGGTVGIGTTSLTSTNAIGIGT